MALLVKKLWEEKENCQNPFSATLRYYDPVKLCCRFPKSQFLAKSYGSFSAKIMGRMGINFRGYSLSRDGPTPLWIQMDSSSLEEIMHFQAPLCIQAPHRVFFRRHYVFRRHIVCFLGATPCAFQALQGIQAPHKVRFMRHYVFRRHIGCFLGTTINLGATQGAFQVPLGIQAPCVFSSSMTTFSVLTEN